MPAIERIVDLLAEQYRWGLHPMKLFAALLVPVLIVWLADRWLRVRSDVLEERMRGPGGCRA
ncbi:MAG: hypothetical protein ACJ79A_01555 [Gemmatimonadaceae bacterium]